MIPDWKLERYLTGDLPEGEMREIRELEKTDEIFAHRVKLLREDNAAILKKLPFEKLSEKFKRRFKRRGSRSRREFQAREVRCRCGSRACCGIGSAL